jgi:hypothetical protein
MSRAARSLAAVTCAVAVAAVVAAATARAQERPVFPAAAQRVTIDWELVTIDWGSDLES